jgi:two-component system phosphate regulon response regulator PhoB
VSEKLSPTILVIEPDEVKSTLICNVIERYCFNAIKTKDATSVTVNQRIIYPNLIIISAYSNNIEVSEIMNKISSIPSLAKLPVMLILDQSESTDDIQRKISANIQDVLYRPFVSSELMSMIKYLLRKSQPVFQEKIIKYKDISIDLATYKVFYKNRPVHLGPTEFNILQLFVQSPETVYSREYIIEYVWGKDKVIEDRTVDVHINRLRGLIKFDGDEQLIKTIRASGYCLGSASNYIK